MGKLVTCAVLLLAAVQAGCVNSPTRRDFYVRSLEPVQPTCDTSVRYIDLVGKVTNRTGGDVDFDLDDFEGPPFDPTYMSYRVWAGPPGGRMELVHNSGHDSLRDRTVTVAPGDSVRLHIPIFALRPADYYHYFRIEYRDSRNRPYWTPEFTLCALPRLNCGCPAPVATSARAAAPACPMAAASSPAVPDAREISLVCR